MVILLCRSGVIVLNGNDSASKSFCLIWQNEKLTISNSINYDCFHHVFCELILYKYNGTIILQNFANYEMRRIFFGNEIYA